jgi:hypothetical protein
MPSTLRGYVLTAIQAVLVVGGGVTSVLLLYSLATIPPAPPGSDGFVTGAAYLWGGVVLVCTLGVTGVGFVLPTVFGADGLFGFHRYQQTVLKAAGACFVGGFLLAVVVTITADFLLAVLVFFLAVLLGFLGVAVALGWRLSEVVLDKLGRRSDHVQ